MVPPYEAGVTAIGRRYSDFDHLYNRFSGLLVSAGRMFRILMARIQSSGTNDLTTRWDGWIMVFNVGRVDDN
jgi:hypothetical protein